MNGVVLITQAEYARRRGVAKSAVTKAVSERRITLIDGKIDPVVADIQWERNTRARADGGRSTTEPRPTSSAGEGQPADGVGAPQGAGVYTPTGVVPQTVPPSSADEGEYSVNRARRERYEADLAQMRLQELQGDLVRVAEVRAEIAKQVGTLKTNLLQIPARLRHLLTPEAHAALDAELRQVLSTGGGTG